MQPHGSHDSCDLRMGDSFRSDQALFAPCRSCPRSSLIPAWCPDTLCLSGHITEPTRGGISRTVVGKGNEMLVAWRVVARWRGDGLVIE